MLGWSPGSPRRGDGVIVELVEPAPLVNDLPARAFPTNLSPSARRSADDPSAAAERGRVVAPTLDAVAPMLAIGAIVLLGLALRILCARGPLSVDEIWSILNLQPLTTAGQILWGISHDNNHFANSLWLYFATRASFDEIWLRAPSILAGALTIAAMARLGARQDAPTAVAAAALTSASFFFVNYSAEARGYAAAILFLAIAYGALEAALDHPNGRSRYLLAAASGLALFCHLASASAIILFAVIAIGETWRRRGEARLALSTVATIFWPTGLAILPTTGCVVAGYIVMGRFTFGGMRPFSFVGALGGITRMMAATLGPPNTPATLIALAVLAPMVVATAIFALASARRRIAYCAFLFVLPAAVFVVQPLNAHYPRYYFACAIFLVLLSAESFGALWRREDWKRWAALSVLAVSLFGGVLQTWNLVNGNKNSWPNALETIFESGQLRFGGLFGAHISPDAAFFDQNNYPRMETYYFNRAHYKKIELVTRDKYCVEKPDWFIVANFNLDPRPSLRLDVPGNGCNLTYVLSGIYGASGLSQMPWALYGRTADEEIRPGLF